VGGGKRERERKREREKEREKERERERERERAADHWDQGCELLARRGEPEWGGRGQR
jgi:hypothetical protein